MRSSFNPNLDVKANAKVRLKLLFVCSKNQWRSPTAEQIWRKDARFDVRSGGTSRGARRSVNAADIAWCDVVFVMEEKHKKHLHAHFQRELATKSLYVLDIPDEYQYMDPELIETLSDGVAAILGLNEWPALPCHAHALS